MLEKDTGVQALPVLQTAVVTNQINLKKKTLRPDTTVIL